MSNVHAPLAIEVQFADSKPTTTPAVKLSLQAICFDAQKFVTTSNAKQMDEKDSFISGVSTGLLWVIVAFGVVWLIDVSRIRQL